MPPDEQPSPEQDPCAAPPPTDPSPRARRTESSPAFWDRWRDVVWAISLSNLCLIQAWSLFFSETREQYFFRAVVTKPAVLALAANLLWLAALIWLVDWWLGRRNDPVRRWQAWLLIGVLLFFPFNFLRRTQLLLTAVPALLVSGLVLLAATRWPQTAFRFARGIVLIWSPLAAFTGWRIACLLWSAPWTGPAEPAQAPWTAARPSPAPRVVWMIFDELDWRIAFPQRPPECRLPEFDRLRAEGLEAGNALPPAGKTLTSLPALLTGHYVTAARPVDYQDLEIRFAEAPTPVSWRAQPNLFSRARDLGCHTALLGWYHPYERLFSPHLNFVRSYGLEQTHGATFFSSLARQLGTLTLLRHRQWLHRARYHCMLADARILVSNPAWDLVLLHLPVPHPPGIYDLKRDELRLAPRSIRDGYLGNLRLADRTLGLLRQEMEASGLWERSWVIVSSDHGWREVAAYDGQLDHHVPFLVKPPGPSQPLIYGAPLNTVVTHDLILAILRNQCLSGPDVAAWLERHPASPLPDLDVTRAPPEG